ncbi:MAG: phosphoribosyltransferase family protein [Desulfurococcaceae archaeon]
MDSETAKVKYISWNAVRGALNELAKRVAKEYKPEVIVAIAKGGLVPARVLSDLLGVEEIGLVEAKFYRGVAIRGDKPFIKSLALPRIQGRSVLVVDDVVDSGRTIQLVIDTLAVQAPKALKSAVLYLKPWSTYTPDYFYAVANEWIVFPWEVCEALNEGVLIRDEEFVDTSKYCVAASSD